MTNKESYKNYFEFSFEDFLQDNFFISSMKKPTPETLAYWDHFQEQNKNLENFYAAKDCIESIDIYHHNLSSRETEKMRRTIHKKKNGKKQNQRLLYISIGVAAGFALLMIIRFLGAGKGENTYSQPDIMAFADMTKSKTKVDDVQLVLSDEQSILLDKAEVVITYDTKGIVVDKKAIAQNNTAGFNQLIVPLGKRSVLNLSDGTKVWVNADTRLIYPVSFADEVREIFVDGEIFIDVVADAKRPFVVKTKDLNIQVLGTQFNVTAYDADDEKKIVLVSGSVQIESKKDENIIRLNPDQMYTSEQGQSHVETVDTKKYTSWIDGIYYCEDEFLCHIFQRLSRYYGVEIVCDQSISEVEFSGKLDLRENLSDIFNNISFTLPISYVEENGVFLISEVK